MYVCIYACVFDWSPYEAKRVFEHSVSKKMAGLLVSRGCQTNFLNTWGSQTMAFLGKFPYYIINYIIHYIYHITYFIYIYIYMYICSS